MPLQLEVEGIGQTLMLVVAALLFSQVGTLSILPQQIRGRYEALIRRILRQGHVQDRRRLSATL